MSGSVLVQRFTGVGAAAVLVAGAITLIVRGGGTGEALDAVFPKAYAATIAAGSAKVAIHMTITTPEGQQTESGSGEFDWVTHEGTLDETVSVAGSTISVSAVVDGSEFYIHFPAAARSALGGKQWVKLSTAGLVNPSSGGLIGGFSPAQTLSALTAESTSLTKVGSATIDGVATTHYRAEVDTSRRSPEAGPILQKIQAQMPALTGQATYPIDVWVDGTGRARQFKTTITLKQPPAGEPAAARAGFPATTTVVSQLSHYGTPVSVTIPPANQVSSLSLQNILGGAGGS